MEEKNLITNQKIKVIMEYYKFSEEELDNMFNHAMEIVGCIKKHYTDDEDIFIKSMNILFSTLSLIIVIMQCRESTK